jgi:3-oxoacyl-[acyl-carrier protein] reductase
LIDPELQDKTVIVTGANHGIGAATAIAFARQGARVLINYFRPAAEAYGVVSDEEVQRATAPGRAMYYKMQTQSPEPVVAAVAASGGVCREWEADLADPDSIPKLFDKAEAELGPVDVLFNNAAFGQCDTFIPPSGLQAHEPFVDVFPIAAIGADSHDRHFAVNSRGTALMMAEYAKRHIARNAERGRIINTSSDGAHAHPSAVSYGASKLAMESYTRAAAMELGPYGITVNVVSPGAVQTGWISGELQRQIEESYPLRRMGRPEDIAHAIVFLASAQADWITGQVLHVGGGNRM